MRGEGNVLGENERLIVRQQTNWSAGVALIILIGLCHGVQAQETAADGGSAAAQALTQRQVMIDVYYRAGEAGDEAWLAWTRAYAERRPGLRVIAREVSSDAALAERLQSIRQVLKLPGETGPVVYGLSRAIHQAADEAELGRQMDRLLLIELYSRPNCPHCDQAEQHLRKRLVDYPALRLVKRDVASDSQAQAELQAELRRRNTSTATVPVLALANQLLIGFDQQQKSGEKIDAILQQWSVLPKRAS